MKWLNWKRAAAGVAAVTAGVAFAVGRGERMPAPAYLDPLLADLPAAVDKLAPHSPVRVAIERGDLEAARAMLSFRPYDEGPKPEGFPDYTPVGVIEVKRYPEFRKAVGDAFWPLFRHISSRDIPMTVPVEMTKASQDGNNEMAFLYQNTRVGQIGPVDEVAVEDNAETLVASLGVRGRIREGSADEAKAALQAWLADQTEYRAVGDDPFRMFGYNSPMVPDSSKYWEVQMLIERAE